MQVAGIVAEYNPFHLGHGWHIAETRRLLGGDAGIVCVMSGNFVQRGEAAAMDKRRRAECALLGGADLVLELPTVWAAASAESFAQGAVALLAATGVVDVLLDMMVQATKNGRVMACYVFFIHTIFFLITGSFYVTCTVLGPMVAPLFPKYGLSKVNLGRILLDTGVGFSPIVPWAMMGGFISNTLGVAVTDYFLFATLPYLNMIISLLYLITGFTVVPAGPDEAEQPREQS